MQRYGYLKVKSKGIGEKQLELKFIFFIRSNNVFHYISLIKLSTIIKYGYKKAVCILTVCAVILNK